MNLGQFSVEELLLAAIESEVESKNVYTKLAKKIKNGLIKDKFQFLASEEEKHRQYIEEIYLNHFPDQKIKLPKESPVPLPEIHMTEDTPISKILHSAMEAEKAASEFYDHLSTRFPKDCKIETMLKYFASMEMGHYKLLELEKESMERFEEADVYDEMVHVGP
jgi:rubrerythrin